jgi:hypothetical protein
MLREVMHGEQLIRSKVHLQVLYPVPLQLGMLLAGPDPLLSGALQRLGNQVDSGQLQSFFPSPDCSHPF